MSEDALSTRLQLEQATAPELEAGSPRESETAALRERYLAFGRAVALAGKPLDEGALVARLLAVASEQPEVSEIVKPAPRSRPLLLLLLGGALAASALIAVVRIASQWPTAEQIVSSQPGVFPADSARPVALAKITAPDAETTAKLTGASAVLSWDDPLDNEIATAQFRLSIMAGRTADLDGELTGIDQQLESLSSDLEDGSL